EEHHASHAIALAEEMLSGRDIDAAENSRIPASGSYNTMDDAIKGSGGADLCIISIAGKYAAAEAMKALSRGMHVMLFSDNVSLDDELLLKQTALKKGLLMMGPDCGTAIINGVPLAFANVIPKGDIGIVSAAGTGLQEVAVGIVHYGKGAFGISQAFGTGGRDGKREIGGLMLCACLQYLIEDVNTKTIVLIAKTPDPEVRDKIWALLAGTQKKVIVNFLKDVEIAQLPNMHYSKSLTHTAKLACGLDISEPFSYPEIELFNPPSHTKMDQIGACHPKPERQESRNKLVALYSGGTLAYEARSLYKEAFGIEPGTNLNSDEDLIVDLGDDEYTVGRLHPMMDYSFRINQLQRFAKDKAVAVILLDIVLGYGAHPDPASELESIINKTAEDISIVCHVLGTEKDPQGASGQIKTLQEAGATVFQSNHQAVSCALKLLQAYRGVTL
ncbi:MAG: FdrA, partial [Candidatus Cloacimonadaceae bacterium]|nr:FdrA [Candidatus Cloacimonadaceae bacterium]